MFWLIVYISAVGTISFILSLKPWMNDTSWVPWHCRFLTTWWIGLAILPLGILSLPWLAYSIATEIENQKETTPRFRFPKELAERRDYN